VSWTYEGVTCDEYGTPRGRRSHRIVCDEDGEHLEGTCPRVWRLWTLSLEEAGNPSLPACRVCHREGNNA